MHGDLRGAAAAHPLGPPLGVLLLAWSLTGARSADSPLDPRRWRVPPALLVAAGAVWLGWAVRRAARG